MPLTKITNLRNLELVERIAQLVDIDAPLPGVFRYVLTKNNNEWSLLMGVLTFEELGSDKEHQACWHKYPNFQFVCRPFDGIVLSKLMYSLNNDGYLPIADLPNLGPKKDNLNWTESLTPSHASRDSFPERCFSVRFSSDVYCDESKLIAHDMDFHASAFEYVREFLGLDRFHGSSDARKGELSIKIPDQRGHLTLSNRDIRFHCGTTDKLSVVGAIDGKPVTLKNPEDTFAFEHEKASDMELWLITDSNEVIDYRSTSEWEYLYDTQTGDSDLTELLQIISGGESEHCEFKPYIELAAKKNNKVWEIDKTVCAFSNHQGGKLFIGVNDDTRIIGINEGCQKSYECEPREGVERYLKAVTKRLQESLIKNQCFTAYLIEQNELFVLVIEVHKANDLNYLRHKNEAYIRRGASSPQMTLAEVKAFKAVDNSLGHELYTNEQGMI